MYALVMSKAQTHLTEPAAPWLRYQPMGLADLADAIVKRLYSNGIRPFKQFCMDWNYYTEDSRRKNILKEDIRGVCPAATLPAIASVVHGLCERDGLSDFLPEYLLESKAEEELVLPKIPINHPWLRKLRDAAPDVCWQHNVFYEEEMLYSTCSVLTSIRKQL